MKKSLLLAAAFTLLLSPSLFAQDVRNVAPFEKVIVSPHVKVTFSEGDKESVTIQNCTVGKEKIHIENNGKTLRVYLEGAKEVTKNEKGYEDESKRKKPLYSGTVLTLAISYKTLNALSVRGEETIELKSKIDQPEFDLNVYGSTSIYFNQVKLQQMHTTIYGESYLEFKAGSIDEQKFTTYGESKVNALGIANKITRSVAYGESELELNTSDEIKVTAYGEAKVSYKGNPTIKKGITIGGVKIRKLD
jgi:hypothetical protein